MVVQLCRVAAFVQGWPAAVFCSFCTKAATEHGGTSFTHAGASHFRGCYFTYKCASHFPSLLPHTHMPDVCCQCANPCRYGSWAVCFTYACWFGVSGLVARGYSFESDTVSQREMLGKTRPGGDLETSACRGAPVV